jgi:hypothetical protein
VVFNKTKENAKYYGWDNEFGHKVVPVAEHRAARHLVSNAEYDATLLPLCARFAAAFSSFVVLVR